MFKSNRNLLIIALIALVNMLGYGIIIPILYSYSKRFGLSDFQNGLLFASYSICQFISTPIIGRLSDKFGRKPMLLVSISGTVLSFFTLAFAPSAAFLFIARMVDGLTAGNIPVIFAVISDTTKDKDRAGAFGLVGASLSFGFIFGPAVSALTIGIGEAIPFIIAGIIALAAVILTAIYLPETNRHMGEVRKGKLIDIPLLWRTLFDPNIGVTFLITLIFFLAFSCAIIYGFQPFTLNVLKVSQSQNAVLFTLFGIVGFLSQSFVVKRISAAMGIEKAFTASILFTAFSFLVMFFSHTIFFFVLAMIILSLFNSVVQTLIPTILSRQTDAKSQGSIMGLNTSYQSVGMIFGPIIGGIVATEAVRLPFLLGTFFVILCFFLSLYSNRPRKALESAFN